MSEARKPGRPVLPAGKRKGEVFKFRGSDEDLFRLRRLSARRGEPDSEVMRVSLEALEREDQEEHGGALRRLLERLGARSPLEALQRVQELLGRVRAA